MENKTMKANWFVIQPIDVVKARWQTFKNEAPTIRGSVIAQYRNEGAQSFWKGLTATMLVMFHFFNSFLFFFFYFFLNMRCFFTGNRILFIYFFFVFFFYGKIAFFCV